MKFSKKPGIVLVMIIIMIAIFIASKGTPANSELHFAEHSILGESAGSVIPASCESAPTYDHVTHVACPPPNVNLHFQ